MNKTWLITGASRGLGRAFVAEAVRQGDTVIAGVRKTPSGDALFSHERVLTVPLDVTDTEQVSAAVRAGVEKFGRIDVLVNNTGFGMSGTFEEVSDSELRTLFETDYFGVANVTRAVLPTMRSQKGGMILNVSSQGGLMGFLGSTAYVSAKFAVVGLSLSLGMELSQFGIQVSAVCPGAFRTDFRDPSSMRHPATEIPAYDGSAVHKAREFLSANNHKQEGDPAKAAAFIYGIVQGGTLPKRILIGKKCCADVSADLSAQLAEIKGYEKESGETDF